MLSDPNEMQNLAFDPDHQHVAQAMRNRLLDIMIGDNRVDFGGADDRDHETKVFCGDFAPGADDKELEFSPMIVNA